MSLFAVSTSAILLVTNLTVHFKSGENRGVNRDSFAVSMGGFDTHFDLTSVLNEKLAMIGSVLKGFRDELVNLGLWDSITVVVSSEFGRTVTPNSSAGTDHGWGGHHMIMGGKVRTIYHRCCTVSGLSPISFDHCSFKLVNLLDQRWQDIRSSPPNIFFRLEVQYWERSMDSNHFK